jgi:hypothetical protein
VISQSHQNQHMMKPRRLLLLKSGTLPSLWEETKKLDYLHLKDLLKYEWEFYWKQPLTPPQHKNIAAYLTLNHRLAIEIGQWTIIPIFRDTKRCHPFSYNAVENLAHFVLECPLYRSIRDKFPSQFENVILGSLKVFL